METFLDAQFNLLSQVLEKANKELEFTLQESSMIYKAFNEVATFVQAKKGLAPREKVDPIEEARAKAKHALKAEAPAKKAVKKAPVKK